MPQETPKFKPYQKVIVTDMLNLSTGERMEMHGTFIRELFHLEEYRGKAFVRLGSVEIMVDMSKIRADDVKIYG